MPDAGDAIRQAAEQVLSGNRVAIFVVAYNAEQHIESVIKRIPQWVAERLDQIYIIDDHSRDDTFKTARNIKWPTSQAPLKIFKTPSNQGYGGNQRLGFSYAIENGIDIVILLHGDGQYAPESLPEILAPYAIGADAVFGSRFITPGTARRGRMPFYKWIGNRILTTFQNKIVGATLSEWHSGYRSYRTSLLRAIPFQLNSGDFVFDTEIIIQTIASGHHLVEVPIPTYYGDEICHVNGIKYAMQCIRTILQFRFMGCELFYDPKFDRLRPGDAYRYTRKEADTSVHAYVRGIELNSRNKVLDVGGGDGRAVSRDHAGRGVSITCVDQAIEQSDDLIKQIRADLDADWESRIGTGSYDTVFALDVIEHLKEPEHAVREIFKQMQYDGRIYASTANVAYFPIRLMLLMGFFNYGRKGILDLTHTRLFTVGTFRRLFTQNGFEVEAIEGFGPPIRDLIAPGSKFIRAIDSCAAWLARIWPSVFAYQILIHARRKEALADLAEKTFR